MELEGRVGWKEEVKTACRRSGLPLGVLRGLTAAKLGRYHERTLKQYAWD